MALNPFKPFATYLRPYRRRVTAGLLLLVVAQAIITVLPLILKEAIDQARAAFADGAAPGAIDAAMGQVGTLAWVVAAPALVGRVVNFGMRWNFTSASRPVERDLRRAYVRHLHPLPLRAIVAAQAGDLMPRAPNEPRAGPPARPPVPCTHLVAAVSSALCRGLGPCAWKACETHALASPKQKKQTPVEVAGSILPPMFPRPRWPPRVPGSPLSHGSLRFAGTTPGSPGGSRCRRQSRG